MFYPVRFYSINDIFIRTVSVWTKLDVIPLNAKSAGCSLPAQKNTQLEPVNDTEMETISHPRAHVVNWMFIIKTLIAPLGNTIPVR